MPFWCDKVAVELSHISIRQIENKYGNIRIRTVEMVVRKYPNSFYKYKQKSLLILKQNYI
jgi:hypothetical protein